jgi:hypothetical protein
MLKPGLWGLGWEEAAEWENTELGTREEAMFPGVEETAISSSSRKWPWLFSALLALGFGLWSNGNHSLVVSLACLLQLNDLPVKINRLLRSTGHG